MKAFVDRLEGEVAVLLIGRRQWDVPAGLLPTDVGEGDTIEITVRKAEGPRPAYDDVDWKEK